jgi:hypothetical protein
MQQTSLESYDRLKDLGMKQKACYDVINSRVAACNYDIAKALGWEINRVTPRVMELRERNLVVEAYRDINTETDRKVIYWKVRP